MYLLGYDVGSSSVKASLVNAETGECIASDFYPKSEAKIAVPHEGWAEQDPENWWSSLKQSTLSIMDKSGVSADDIKAIGISYQMHGLVCVDKDKHLLRPAIIWCDSRAVPYGNAAFQKLGENYCLNHLLNSPGNFTAAKLAWVKDNEPEIFEKIDKIMLPGDYIAMRMTGEIHTTISGLSEGVFWDFKNGCISKELLEFYGFDESILPGIVPTFAEQGRLLPEIAEELGLSVGIPITYRAGDQPNNALSLKVFNPGEIASTAGTSGVVYGINEYMNHDSLSRVNNFAHVNHSAGQTRLGVLLCINGTGILNSWMKHNFLPGDVSYPAMNEMAAKSSIGANGLSILPFGNGVERVLNNQPMGCKIEGLNFNIHTISDLMRAGQEGIVFAFKYGIDIMKETGISVQKIHAGNANMFQSPLFRDTLASVTGATIKLYETDGSVGAAKGAGMGVGYYADHNEAFASLKQKCVIEPDYAHTVQYQEAYATWLAHLNKEIQNNNLK